MSMRSASPDRRRAYRVRPPDAVARCSTQRLAGVYAVHDLSRGGVALNGRPVLRKGCKVSMHLTILGYEPLTLDGTVLRSTLGPGRSTRVAVSFDPLDTKAEDQIGKVIVSEIARTSVPRCIVASASERERRVLSQRLAAMGVQTLQAVTPIEVIHRLETSARKIDAIVIGEQVGDSDGVELASFLAGAYPTLRRVLAGRTSGRRRLLARHVAHVNLDGRWGTDDLRLALMQNKSGKG